MVQQRRPQGTGTLTERPKGSGHWHYRFTLGVDPITGKQIRKSYTFHVKGKRAAEAEVARIRRELAETVQAPRTTVADLFADYTAHQEALRLSPTTLAENARCIRTELLPAFGRKQVADLAPRDIDRLVASWAERGLAPSSMRRYLRVLQGALQQAMVWGLIPSSPAEHTKLPTAPTKRPTSPSPQDVNALIDGCFAHSKMLGTFVFLAAVTGCRRGELGGLRWRNVHADRLVIAEATYRAGSEVGVKSTKSGRERDVLLGEAAISLLHRWRQTCEERANDHGATLDGGSFVFSNHPDGSFVVNIDTITTYVSKIAKQLGLESVTTHSLRHFAATELLGAGVGLRDTADMLGHASPSTTLGIYAGSNDERQKEAANRLGQTLGR